MNEHTRTTLKVIAAFLAGFCLNFAMTVWAAPGHIGTAMATGLLLTAFGFVVAQFAMQLVMLPIAVISFVLRLASGKRINADATAKKSKFDFFGRALFVVAYGFVSAVAGIFIGALDGGLGWATTSALFGTLGILLALLYPLDLIWGADGGNSVFGEPTRAANEDIEQARKEGNPSVLFADKIAKKVVGTLIEKPDAKV